jgi:16S rRNA G527 N7-methylase RsmG
MDAACSTLQLDNIEMYDYRIEKVNIKEENEVDMQ